MHHAAERPVLAIDLGGTQIRAAVITPDLKVHARQAIQTADERGVQSVVTRICELAVAVREEAARAGLPEPIGVGISAPGPLDPWRGVVVSPPNLSGWRGVPLADPVEEALALPTFLERDTNVAVLAEWRYGAGQGARNVIYITVSTGVGGGIVAEGRPIIGPDGTAGEVGHLTVEIDGPACGCGRLGHVEAIGSGTALAREARALLAAGTAPILARLAESAPEVDAKLLGQAADAGDSACLDALERAWLAIGAGCASLVNALNPEVIVIGGAIAEHRPRVLEVARAEIVARAFEVPARRVRVVRPALGDDVSLIGALPIVNERLDDPTFRRAPASTEAMA
ncbi:MAG: ROK family protein [Chloroflexi bacterium]|nr:ROK family protein [Chloroflexota bacterium]